MENTDKPSPSDQLKQEKINLKLYAFGSRESDQYYHPLGYAQSKRPVCLSTITEFVIADEMEEGQQKKERIIVNPLFNRSIYRIACGGLHTVVLTSCGEVYTFGCNDEGALGRKGDQCIPIKVQLEDPVDLIAAGDNHSLFANSVNGAIYFTGNYNFLKGQKIAQSVLQPIKFFVEQIDTRNKNKPIDKIVSGANHSIILIGGRVFCRGQPQAYTVGRRINGRKVKQNCLIFDGVGVTGVLDVWCGGYHSVVKCKKGQSYRYYCWGSNSRGQLGINGYEPQPYPVEIKKLRGIDVVKVSGGTFFTIFLTNQGQVYGCGSNENANMGLGSDFNYQDHLSDFSEHELKQREKQEIQKQERQKQEKQKKQKKEAQQLQLKMTQKLVINDKTPMMQQKKQQEQHEEEKQEKNQQRNIYIKSLRKIQIPQKISNISCGSNFTYAWNQQSVYTWGFGMNYVLLNGQEDDQEVPFKVKSKILNQETIYDLVAGGQHVVYTAYEMKDKESNKNLSVDLQPNVKNRLSLSRQKLPRKRQK